MRDVEKEAFEQWGRDKTTFHQSMYGHHIDFTFGKYGEDIWKAACKWQREQTAKLINPNIGDTQ